MTKEADVQLEIQRWVVQNGGYVIKTHGSQFSGAGVPDLIGFVPVRTAARPEGSQSWGVIPFAVEVKTEQTVTAVTPIQEHVIQSVLRAGAASGVATGVISFQRLLAAWIHKRVVWGLDSLPDNAASMESVMATIGITVSSVGDADDNNKTVESPDSDGGVDEDPPELSDSGGDADG